MTIFGRSIYAQNISDVRNRRASAFLSAYNRPYDFSFEGLKLTTQQNSREKVLRVERAGNVSQFFTVDTDSDGDVLLNMSAGGGGTAGISVEAGGGCKLSLSDGVVTRFIADESGTSFPWKQTEISVNTSILIQDRWFPVTVGGRTVTLSDGNWAEGALTDGDWFGVYDQNGNAAASPITIDCSGSTVNGVSTNLTISENYGGYYFQYNGGDDEWVAWKMQPAHENTSGIVAGVVASSVDITLTGSNYTVLMSPIVAARTVNLPAAANHQGRIYNIKHAFNTSNAVTIDGNGSETIDGATTQTLAYLACLTIQCDGSNWHIL